MIVHVQRWIVAALALLIAAAAAAAAQTGAITGRVTDADGATPVEAAQVEARLSTSGAVTAANAVSDAGGAFRISGLTPGIYIVTVRRIGYAAQSLTDVRVGSGQTAEVAVSLRRAAQDLGDVVIVTAGRRAEKATEAPAHVEVVPTERIEERPALTTTDQVRGVPGVDVATTGIMGGSVVARGFNNVFSGAMLVLTDNRIASVPSLRVNTPFLYPTTNEDIGRIEVVLGPGSALYGPNAASGVMHIITRSPFEWQGTTASLGAGVRSQSEGIEESMDDRWIFRTALKHAGTAGSQFGYKVTGQYMSGTDWRFNDPAEPAGRRDFDVQRWTGEARVDWRPNQSSTVVLSAGRSQAGSAIELTGLGAAQAIDWTYDYYQARANVGRLFAQLFLNTSNAGETFLLRTNQRITDESRLLVGQVQHGLELGTRQNFTYGVDVQFTEPRTGGTITGRNEETDEITEVGGYLQSETALSPLFNFLAAARVDKHSKVDDAVFSPRAALVFKPTGEHNIRLTYNRAFSTPSTNNLFLDVRAGQIPIPGTPGYDVRTLGTPGSGLQFRRDCTTGPGGLAGVGGLCMRSPFNPSATGGPETFLPANAVVMYQAAVEVVKANLPNTPQGAQVRALLDATTSPTLAAQRAQIQTQLRQLNPTTGTFGDVTAAQVRDLPPIEPSTSTTYELGYNGILGRRLRIAADVYREERRNFVGPLIVETPNVFLERATLETFLRDTWTPIVGAAQAQALAAQIAPQMAGEAGSATVRGIPLGVVNLNNPLNNPTDIILAYRNFGKVTLWGADLAAEANVTDRISVEGTYSWVERDFFEASEVGGISPIAINAPKNKMSLGVRFRDEPSGLSLVLRGRNVAGFPMNSGVYVGDVEGYTVFDANVAYRLPIMQRRSIVSLTAQNLGEAHREFVGAPVIGPLVLGQLQFTF